MTEEPSRQCYLWMREAPDGTILQGLCAGAVREAVIDGEHRWVCDHHLGANLFDDPEGTTS